LWWYLGVCLVLSSAVYGGLALLPLIMGLPVFLVYQVINFHHYVVDAVIWRREQVQLAMRDV
jgi:hypothetical protein